MKTLSKVSTLALALSVFAVACDTATDPAVSGPEVPGVSAARHIDFDVPEQALFERLRICKKWVGGSSILTDFDVTTNNDLDAGGGQSTETHTLADVSGGGDLCRGVVTFDGTQNGNQNTDFMEVVEDQPTGTHLVSIEAYQVNNQNVVTDQVSVSAAGATDSDGFMTVDFDAKSFTATLGDNTVGYLVIFTNEEDPPEGGQGCTPGYWKQEQHYDSWPAVAGIGPNMLFTAAGFTSPGSDARYKRGQNEQNVSTQVMALEANQGDLAALTRHAMAALLNALNPDVAYDLSAADVISMYNAVLAGTGDLEDTHNLFAGYNEQGCPLN
ncbi:MAG: hypothetical protein R3195_05735 [Gemmatimonadota bacterium]|nr:hypothetical protein [Gemmatimonadota bacterium]